jgi:hypothetical protein
LLRTIETKGQFAKRKKRAASSISAWIAEGKITSAALIGTGSRARIWVEQAEADLAAALVPSQQWSQEFPANERSSVKASATGLPARSTGEFPQLIPSPALSDLEIDRARRAKADADIAEHNVRMAKQRELLERGRLVNAKAAAAQMSKLVGQTIAVLEGALPQMAMAMANRFSVPNRDALHELRLCFRNARAAAAAQALDEAAQMPEFIEVQYDDEDNIISARAVVTTNNQVPTE